jgi:protease I
VFDRKNDLEDKTIAILAADGFEEAELREPLEALQEAGAKARIISLRDSGTEIRGWADGNWSDSIAVDDTVDAVNVDDFDALLLPGGLMSPDALRADRDAVQLVREFFATGKPVAAICHGPWLIAEADAAEGRTLTSYPSIQTDMKNAGAEWIDSEVVVDQGLVTSRSPKDLDAFIAKMLEEIGEGVHEGQHA